MPVNDTKIPSKYYMPDSEHKSPLLPVNNTKIHAKEDINASDQKKPSFTDNNINMPDDDRIPVNK